MSFDEIKTLFYKMEGKVSNETEMKKGISAVDTNKDGFIDMGEFMAFNYQTGKSEGSTPPPTTVDPSKPPAAVDPVMKAYFEQVSKAPFRS
jgi:hypothetical protein